MKSSNKIFHQGPRKIGAVLVLLAEAAIRDYFRADFDFESRNYYGVVAFL